MKSSLLHPRKNLKSLLIILLLIFSASFSLDAQDIIKLKSGKELKAVIVEENNDIIKYRDYSDQGGPLFTVKKELVASVKYKKPLKAKEEEKAVEQKTGIEADKPVASSTGKPQLTVKQRYVYLDGKAQSHRSVKTFFEEYPEALSRYESGTRLLGLSNTCLGAVIVSSFIAGQMVQKQETEKDRMAMSIAGLGISCSFFATAIIATSAGKKRVREAVEIYNKTEIKPVSYTLNLGITSNGVGLVLKF